MWRIVPGAAPRAAKLAARVTTAADLPEVLEVDRVCVIRGPQQRREGVTATAAPRCAAPNAAAIAVIDAPLAAAPRTAVSEVDNTTSVSLAKLLH